MCGTCGTIACLKQSFSAPGNCESKPENRTSDPHDSTIPPFQFDIPILTPET